MATKYDILRTHLPAWLTARNNRKRRAEVTKHVCFVTGMHPKSVSRAFRREQMRDGAPGKRRGRPVTYGPDVTAALKDVWDAANEPCGELLFPIIAEYVRIFRRDADWTHSAKATRQLLAMKEHTVRRRVTRLRTYARTGTGLSSTKPSLLKAIIPVFKGPWAKLPPGHGQLDTVAHCGSTLLGDFVYTVNYTDFSTYWIVLRAQWNKGQAATLSSMQSMKAALPFAWLMGHPDSGSEFINWVAKAWFDEQGIALTRSEPSKSNDNMCVEERNGHVVRRYLGYVRFDVPEVVPLMNEMYTQLALYLNHFIPVRRTLSKERVGATYHRVYEKRAVTPYARVLAHPGVSVAVKTRLRREHTTLNPLVLKRRIDTLTAMILSLQSRNSGADRATNSR